MADGSSSPFKPVRYVVTQTNGSPFSQAGRLYFADLRAHTAAQAVTLYDHTRWPQNLITRLVAPAEGASAPFPPLGGVSVPVRLGVYVSFSSTAWTGVLGLGWDRQ